ncbi:polysaccharide pyruvyl transferase family protein [Mesonia sp. K7]|uniref:polysaccharide pyruvyl transferase family protein n=1 Tax=Mesonia sp. K7 TaxID=2218606 RepID=UPI000DA7DECA|nr:polysaccharide pyruvyl transferase family protein [Mesonia sp. K7]PZD79111.1 polysaccharide pyruvyl transferase family protein [Mesonia sp. K7]
MNILFEGYYGYKNAGDDAFVEVASWGSQTYWNSENNTFIGQNLPQTISPIKTKSFLNNKKGFDRISFLNAFLTNDFFISAGGSTFSEMPIHSNKSLARLISYTKKMKLGAIGVSVGPFKNLKDEVKVQKYLKSISFLALRDTRSYEYVKTLNLPYQPVKAFDLAALLPEVYQYQKKSSPTKTTIGLSICNYESYTGGSPKKEKNRNLFFKEVVKHLDKNMNIHFKVFIINGNPIFGDQEISKNLVEGINPEKIEFIPYQKELKKTWDEIASCDLVISTRLHASIFACFAQVPFLLIEYHKKCTDFLKDVGQSKDYFLGDAELSPKKVFTIVEGILNEGYSSPKNIGQSIDLARSNFTHPNILGHFQK